ncbi:MAG: PDZ domain-containing protein [Deltaproteobacteria bacterium]|nr:PDZ domain-containing protein [Deltaproteobacteria bacterium]
MIVRIATTIFALVLISAPARAQEAGINVTIPLVEETLRFLRNQALSIRPEAAFLRAGVISVCGKNMERPGCRPDGVPIPKPNMIGPDATQAWRRILESVIVTETIQQGDAFDKTAFQRFVMNGMVEALEDPASFYLVPSVYRKIGSIPSGFVGFGLRVFFDEDTLRVGAVHADSPASAAGLRLGDLITKVNDQPVTGYHRPLALAAIWGAEGNNVKLEIKRAGETRDVSVAYKPWTFHAFTVEKKGDVILVKISYFDRGLVDAVRESIAGSKKGIVIDLRGAASGNENEMVGFADLLLEKGSIGSKKTRLDLGNRTWKAEAGSRGERTDLATAVIIDSSTSGLAEVLVSALRKNTRAILIGQETSGEDTQETMRTFRDGSAIQITSTQLFGPSETPLSAGIKPHLKTDRSHPDDLAVSIVKKAAGPSMDDLLDAGREAVK